MKSLPPLAGKVAEGRMGAAVVMKQAVNTAFMPGALLPWHCERILGASRPKEVAHVFPYHYPPRAWHSDVRRRRRQADSRDRPAQTRFARPVPAAGRVRFRRGH